MGLLEVLVEELFELKVHGELLLFATLLLKPEQKPFPGRIIVFGFQIHDGRRSGGALPLKRK